MSSFTKGPLKTYYPNGTVDLSAKQYYIVKGTAANTVDLATTSSDFILGTINNVDRAGQEVEVFMRNGTSSHKVVLGGTVAYGDALTANSSSKAVATTTAGDQFLGRAMQAGVSGDIIEYAPTGFVKYA
jgi:hypothetical protein